MKAPSPPPITAPIPQPTTTPISQPTTTPSAQPTTAPSAQPTSPHTDSPTSSCIPTIGPCVSTFPTLLDAFADVADNDVVALCGKISTLSEPVVRANNLTICCEDDRQACSLTAVGNHRNLVAEGASFRLQGITFRNGSTSDTEGAGNVGISGEGNHSVVDCVSILLELARRSLFVVASI